MNTASLERAVTDFKGAAERLRLTVVEDAPPDAPRPVHELAELVTELESLLFEDGDLERLRRRSHRLLLQAYSWPLVADLNAVANERGGAWSSWLETVWWGLHDLGVLIGRIDDGIHTSRSDSKGDADG
jgi:hypothetical protein